MASCLPRLRIPTRFDCDDSSADGDYNLISNPPGWLIATNCDYASADQAIAWDPFGYAISSLDGMLIDPRRTTWLIPAGRRWRH